MSLPTSPTWTVSVTPPGVMDPCSVCETTERRRSARLWAHIPCMLEVLDVCLHCGNTIRHPAR